jgi:hypothetical protein
MKTACIRKLSLVLNDVAKVWGGGVRWQVQSLFKDCSFALSGTTDLQIRCTAYKK